MSTVYMRCPCCGRIIELSVSCPGLNYSEDKDIYPNEVSPSYLEKHGYYCGVTEEVNAK